MFERFQQSLPKIIFGFLVALLVYFVFALLGKNGVAYSFALKKEVVIIESQLTEYEKINAQLVEKINLWDKFPNQMAEEVLVSKWAFKHKSAEYFEYLND